jgi:hypothetical protein
MKRFSRSGAVAALALSLVLALFFAGGPPASALPLGQRVLHRDFALLPYIEQDNLFSLTLVRRLSGALLLIDSTGGTRQRRTQPLLVTVEVRSTVLSSLSTSRLTSREAPLWVVVCRLPIAPLSVRVTVPEPAARPEALCHEAVLPERL